MTGTKVAKGNGHGSSAQDQEWVEGHQKIDEKAANARYWASKKGKAYEASQKRKACKKTTCAKYLASEQQKATSAKYLEKQKQL